MAEQRRLLRSALAVALTYALASSVWILGTDVAAGVMAGVPLRVIVGSISKGLFFVLATTVGLYFLVRAQLFRIQAAEARRQRSERMRDLGEIASGITNDFKKIFASCGATAAHVQAQSSDPVARDAMERISAEIRRAEALAEEVLLFAEPRAPRLEKVALEPLLEQLHTDVQATLGTVPLQWSVEPRGLAVLGDAGLLSRAIRNVVENAREAMSRNGSIVIRARVARSLPDALRGRVTGKNDLVELTVHDTGHGMEPEILARMFDPLVTTKRDSTGLGLAIVHRTVHEHGGVVSADSVPGAGTTVSIVLPAWKA